MIHLKVVMKYKYLGHILQYNLEDLEDIEFRLNSFYAKFNWLFRSFENVSIEVFYFLFKSFCMPDYGLGLWNIGEILKRHIFKTFEVAFSNALKKMLGVSVSTSSHAVAEIFSQLLFNHYIIFTQSRFFKRVFNSGNVILRICNMTLISGHLYKMLFMKLSEVYGVSFSRNTLDILKARIHWIQRHEPNAGHII